MRTLRIRDVVNAAIDGLKTNGDLVTLLGGTAKVYTNVPEGTVAPYVHFLSGAESPWGRSMNDDTGAQCDLIAMIYSAYAGTKEVDQIGDQVVRTLTTPFTYGSVPGYAGYAFLDSPAPDQQLVNNVLLYRRRVHVRVFVNQAETP